MSPQNPVRLVQRTVDPPEPRNVRRPGEPDWRSLMHRPPLGLRVELEFAVMAGGGVPDRVERVSLTEGVGMSLRVWDADGVRRAVQEERPLALRSALATLQRVGFPTGPRHQPGLRHLQVSVLCGRHSVRMDLPENPYAYLPGYRSLFALHRELMEAMNPRGAGA